ncbi:MAG TPA: 5-formyltetrahydrofolate cyclo-ligase [Clostridia bacterium]
MSNKEIVRKEALIKRKAFSANEVYDKSRIIRERLLALSEYRKCQTFMCYVSYKNEVDTEEMIRHLLKDGKRVFLPRIMSDKKDIEAVEIKDFDKDLKKGTFGIMEPFCSSKECAGDIDMIIIPGVAYDVNKNRLGYGGGYYDRFLRGVKSSSLKLGLSYDELVYESLPVEEHDIKVDIIITEKRIIK